MAQIPGSARVDQYTATGGQTVFTYTYLVYHDDEILVQSGDDVLTLTADYTVQDAGEETGGTITLVVGATAGDIITLTGNSMIERDTEFTNGGDYLASAINGEYDKLDNITKELVTQQESYFKLATYNPAISKIVPNPTSRRGLVWNAAGTALENTDLDPDVAATAAAASAAAALVSENNAAASEASTAADAIATAADAVQTGLDAAATAADAIATAADAVSTAADAASTAADVITTNADAASTAADVITTNADAASTAADAINTAADAVSTAADAVSCASDASDASDSADDAAVSAAEAAASAASVDLSAVASDIIPDAASTRILGSPPKPWGAVFVDSFDANVSCGSSTGAVFGNEIYAGTKLQLGGVDITPPLSACYSYQVSNGTGGGSYTTPQHTTRPINVELYDDIGITLASNVLTMPAGTYEFDFAFSCHWTDSTSWGIYDNTAAAYITTGNGAYAGSTGSQSVGKHIFTIAVSSGIELRMKATRSQSTTGMGLPNTVGFTEKYLTLLIRKLL